MLCSYVANVDSTADDVVTLAELAKGKPIYDVCRIFLASLQLANTGNIQIEEQPLPSCGRGGSGGSSGGSGSSRGAQDDVRVLDVSQVRFRFRTAEKVWRFEAH